MDRQACASRLPGTWLALQETTCWDRCVQREPSCLAMLRKQMPPPAHASLHPPVPTAPALLGANTSGCGVLMPTEQDTHTHTYTHAHTWKPDTLILPENVPGQSVRLSSPEVPGYRHGWGRSLLQININSPQNAGEGKVRLVLAKASRECRVVLPSQKSYQVLNYPELQKEIPKSSDPICLYFFYLS